MVQRRAARYVKKWYHNTSSVTEIIGQLQWTSLEERRKTARLILLYKISNGLVKIDAADRLITPTRFSRNMHRRSFQIPACHTTARRESFYPWTINDWNALPVTTVTITSLATFKTLLRP
jgi:hypothetical protein